MEEALQGVPYTLEIDPAGRFLAVRLGSACQALSSTLIGGGTHTIDCITWSLGTSLELKEGVDAHAWLEASIRAGGCDPARSAGFITSRRLHAFALEAAPSSEGSVTVVATAGASNALRAGDPVPDRPWRPGTINIAVLLPRPMTAGAMVEVVALAAEAKAAAMLESGIRSVVSGAAASGTGTDAVAVAAPLPADSNAQEATEFAGKHTSLGSAIGQAVHLAVRRALHDWTAERVDLGLPTLREALAPVPTTPRVVLVGGGVRSGKSAFAEAHALALCHSSGSRPVYVATAQAYDDEMRLRIDRHQAERGTSFTSVEEPLELAATLRSVANGSHTDLEETPGAILVDCLTLWLSNLLCEDLDDSAIEERCARLVEVLRELTIPIVLVSNEVGLGIVPESALGRRFRDLAGRLHQRLVGISDEVYLAILGTTLRLCPGPIEQVRP